MKAAIIKKVQKGKNKGQFRFVLKATNTKVIAQSHPETYHNLGDCEGMLKKNFPDFVIEYDFVKGERI